MDVVLLLIFLIACTSGTFVVNVTKTHYEAEERLNITMDWLFSWGNGVSFSSLSIYCGMITPRDLCIFLLRNGEEVPGSQHRQFAGRLQCDKEALREGRVTIHLSRLRTEDSGLYLCIIGTADGRSHNKSFLKVTAARETPTSETSEAESRGRTRLYAALVAAVLAAVALAVVACCYYKCQRARRNDQTSSVV